MKRISKIIEIFFKIIRMLIIVSGIWVWVLAKIIVWAGNRFSPQLETIWRTLPILSIVGMIMILAVNVGRISAGENAFDVKLFDFLKRDLFDDGKGKYEYPAVNSCMLFKEPIGMVFGRQGKKYVCRPEDWEGNSIIAGGSGSGKTSCIILPYILWCMENGFHQLIIDIKGELSSKCISPKTSDAVIINPEDRSSYGFDPFGLLDEDSTQDQITRCIQTICNSLIPPAKSSENDFWSISARSMLFGIISYFYRYEEIRDLTEIIRKALSQPIDQLIKKIIEDVTPGSIEYSSLINFHGMPAETLLSVFSNLKNRIEKLIVDQDLAYALGANPRKVRPQDLLYTSVFLVVNEGNLALWNQFIILIINETMLWAMSDLKEASEEQDRPWMGMVIDETVALLSGLEGKISNLVQGSRFLRSKRFRLTIVCQSIAGLKTVYSPEEVDDLLSNFSYKIILNTEVSSDAEIWAKLIPQYEAKKYSYSGSGINRKTTTSTEKRQLVDLSDLSRLPQKGELILLSPTTGYCRLKKASVYTDPILNKKLQKVQEEKNHESRKRNDPPVGRGGSKS